jgi:hypothetical protein
VRKRRLTWPSFRGFGSNVWLAFEQRQDLAGPGELCLSLLELPFAVRLPGIGRPAPAGWRATLPLDATLEER